MIVSLISHFLPARRMIFHGKENEIYSHRLSWWDRDLILTVCVMWVAGWISGTCQRVIKIIIAPTSYQNKNHILTIASIWLVNILGYLSADIICFEKQSVFGALSSKKTVSFEKNRYCPRTFTNLGNTDQSKFFPVSAGKHL